MGRWAEAQAATPAEEINRLGIAASRRRLPGDVTKFSAGFVMAGRERRCLKICI